MSYAGNTESSRMFRVDSTYLIIFVLLFTGFFTLINLLIGFQESLPQRFLTVLNTASFVTLVSVLILHTIYHNKNTAAILLISCGIFVISYYSYVIFKAFSKDLTIIPYPLLIELKGSSNSVYVVDLPQIIIISLLIRYAYKKHKELRNPEEVETEITASSHA